MPVVQIDWEAIKTLFADETEIIAVTSRQRALLLSLSEQLHWEKTFRDFGYDFADKDTLDAEISDVQHNLTMPVNLTDLIGYIDEIEDLLRLLQNPSVCCEDVDWTGGDQYTEPVDEGSTNGVPQALVDAGWADDTDDWDGFEDWMCAVGNVLVNNMQSKVVLLEDVFDNAGLLIVGAGALLGLLGIIVSSGVSILVAGILTAAGSAQTLWQKLKDGGTDAVPSPEEIELSREELVCAWLDPANDGIDDRISSFHAAIDSEFSALEATILKLLMHQQMIKALYTGSYVQSTGDDSLAQKMYDAGITPSTYDCDCEEPGIFTFDFDSDAEGWTGPNIAYFAYNGTLDCLEGIANTNSTWRSFNGDTEDFYTLSGLTPPQYCKRLRYDIRFDTLGGAALYNKWRIRIQDGTGTYYYGDEHDTDEIGWDTGWHTITDEVSTLCTINSANNNGIAIENYHPDAGHVNQRMRITNITILDD
ncbi:MAG: hypothetical protein PVF65_12475 [Sphingomonadales bacterium]|jgi:hypothetical protein